MPVIINDLEVVIESPTPPGQQQSSSDNDQPPQGELTPYDISVLQRQQRSRAERVKAH